MASILRTHQKLWRYCTAKTTIHNGLIRMYSENATGISKAPKRLIVQKIGDDYPIKELIPVAEDVLKARAHLIKGVSTLLQSVPVWTCMRCPEVHVGETGHLIKTCCGFRRRRRGTRHEWVQASLNDVIIPVHASVIQTEFHNAAEYRKKFSRGYLNCVPAVVDLCLGAGAFQSNEGLFSSHLNFDRDVDKLIGNGSLLPFVGNGNAVLSVEDRKVVAQGTLCAYESVRSGVEELLSAYPVKVLTHHSESPPEPSGRKPQRHRDVKFHRRHCDEKALTHYTERPLGPSGRKPRHCDVFKIKTWQWTPVRRDAKVDDLVPPKVVWFQRPQEPTLLNAYRKFYGHAPAVVDLCTKAGAIPPSKYLSMMKMRDFAAPSPVLALEDD